MGVFVNKQYIRNSSISDTPGENGVERSIEEVGREVYGEVKKYIEGRGCKEVKALNQYTKG
jgi:hypothetical protein